MILLIDPKMTVEKTLDCDKEDKKTKFILRPLTGFDKIKSQVKLDPEDMIKHMLSSALVDVQDSDGGSLINDERPMSKLIEMFDLDVINELFSIVSSMSNLTKDEEKNS